ncbi:hypothetical protein VTK56DRAFT_5564 [Thermocarpiscus australiensis]
MQGYLPTVSSRAKCHACPEMLMQRILYARYARTARPNARPCPISRPWRKHKAQRTGKQGTRGRKAVIIHPRVDVTPSQSASLSVPSQPVQFHSVPRCGEEGCRRQFLRAIIVLLFSAISSSEKPIAVELSSHLASSEEEQDEVFRVSKEKLEPFGPMVLTRWNRNCRISRNECREQIEYCLYRIEKGGMIPQANEDVGM